MVSLISLVGMLLFRLLILLYPIVTNARQLRSNRIDEQYLLRWSEEGKLSDGISYDKSVVSIVREGNAGSRDIHNTDARMSRCFA